MCRPDRTMSRAQPSTLLVPQHLQAIVCNSWPEVLHVLWDPPPSTAILASRTPQCVRLRSVLHHFLS